MCSNRSLLLHMGLTIWSKLSCSMTQVTQHTTIGGNQSCNLICDCVPQNAPKVGKCNFVSQTKMYVKVVFVVKRYPNPMSHKSTSEGCMSAKNTPSWCEVSNVKKSWPRVNCMSGLCYRVTYEYTILATDIQSSDTLSVINDRNGQND